MDISVSRVSLSQGLTLLVSEVGSEPIPRGSSKSDLNYFLFFKNNRPISQKFLLEI